jgi:hypothetical protein
LLVHAAPPFLQWRRVGATPRTREVVHGPQAIRLARECRLFVKLFILLGAVERAPLRRRSRTAIAISSAQRTRSIAVDRIETLEGFCQDVNNFWSLYHFCSE